MAEKTEELYRRWRDPVLAHLRQAQASSLEEPAYVEGLIAYYDGRFEQAIARAKEAFERSPWLYEAKKLEGDAYAQLGLPFRHDRGQNYDKLISFYGPAEEAYRAAAEIGAAIRKCICPNASFLAIGFGRPCMVESALTILWKGEPDAAIWRSKQAQAMDRQR